MLNSGQNLLLDLGRGKQIKVSQNLRMLEVVAKALVGLINLSCL